MVRSIDNSPHFIWANGCDGWHLLQSDSLSVKQEKMPPGTSAQLHYHKRSEQLFYILSGMATMEIAGRKSIINANESIYIPPGAEHFIANNSKEELEFLVISTPNVQDDRHKNLLKDFFK